jgi:hypothetical protein
MTDHPAPTDEDLSLAIDGEADDALLARIEADPDARARLEQMARATARVREATVTALDESTVDHLIGAAVDAPIAPAQPSRRPSRATPWLVAAAVVLLMAFGLSMVWAGRGSDDDQAGATFQDKSAESADAPSDGDPDSSFGSQGNADAGGLAGGHGAPTTAPSAGSSAAKLPLLYLGSYASGNELREATAASFADAWKASGSPLTYDTGEQSSDGSNQARTVQPPPTDAAIDRCAQQLQVTLSMEAPPIQTGYARVDGKDVLAYEFAARSSRTGKETTLVAAVGVDACDAVVIFER